MEKSHFGGELLLLKRSLRLFICAPVTLEATFTREFLSLIQRLPYQQTIKNESTNYVDTLKRFHQSSVDIKCSQLPQTYALLIHHITALRSKQYCNLEIFTFQVKVRNSKCTLSECDKKIK